MKSYIQIVIHYQIGNQVCVRLIESSSITKTDLSVLRQKSKREPGEFCKFDHNILDIENSIDMINVGEPVKIEETFIFYESCTSKKPFKWV